MSLILTIVDELVFALEKLRKTRIFISVKAKNDCTIKRNAASWRDRTAVSPSKWGINQFRRLRLLHFRIHVQVLVNTPVQKIKSSQS